MTPLAPHLSAFLQDHLPLTRRTSLHTVESYAYAFKLLVTYASAQLHVAPSQLSIEQLDAALLVRFLNYLESDRRNGPSSRNVRLAAVKSSCTTWSSASRPSWITRARSWPFPPRSSTPGSYGT